MFTQKQWEGIANHVRSKLDFMFDSANLFAKDIDLHSSLTVPFRGFYIGVVDANGEDITRQGFLKEDLENVLDVADIVIPSVFDAFKELSIPPSKVHTATFHFVVITEVKYLPNPTSWKDSDGVYFMWGQDYRGLYLPYQIQNMNMSNIEVMDRLCVWECGVAANLWRQPEGLCWRLSCHSYKS